MTKITNFQYTKAFCNQRNFAFDLEVTHVFNRDVSLLDDVRHSDTEDVHNLFQHAIRNSPDARPLDDSTYGPSGYAQGP